MNEKERYIVWLKNQKIFFIYNTNTLHFFKDLAEFFEIISTESVYSEIVEQIRELEKKSNEAFKDMQTRVEAELDLLKNELAKKLENHAQVSVIKKLFQEYDSYQQYEVNSTSDRLSEMYHALQSLLDWMKSNNVDGYEKYLNPINEKYSNEPLWKTYLIIDSYNEEKKEFLLKYDQLIQKAFQSLHEVNWTIYSRNEINKEANSFIKEYRKKVDAGTESTEDRKKYIEYSALGNTSFLLNEMEYILNPKNSDVKDVLITGYFEREIFLRHVLKVIDFFIDELLSAKKPQVSPETQPFEVSGLSVYPGETPPKIILEGKNGLFEKTYTSRRTIPFAILLPLVTVENKQYPIKVSVEKIIDSIEQTAPRVRSDSALSLSAADQRIKQYIRDIRKKLDFASDELWVEDGNVCLSIKKQEI